MADIQLDNPALERNGDRVGAIVCTQLGEYVRDVVLDCGFCDRELVGDLLIGIAVANQTKHINFARTQLIVGSVVGQFRRNFGWNSLAPGMDRADRLQQLGADVSFQQVTRFRNSLNLPLLPDFS